MTIAATTLGRRSWKRVLLLAVSLVLVDLVHAAGTIWFALDGPLDVALHALSWSLGAAVLVAVGVTAWRTGGHVGVTGFAIVAIVVVPALFIGLTWLAEGTDRGASGLGLLPGFGFLDLWTVACGAAWPVSAFVPGLLGVAHLRRASGFSPIAVAALASSIAALCWGRSALIFYVD